MFTLLGWFSCDVDLNEHFWFGHTQDPLHVPFFCDAMHSNFTGFFHFNLLCPYVIFLHLF